MEILLYYNVGATSVSPVQGGKRMEKVEKTTIFALYYTAAFPEKQGKKGNIHKPFTQVRRGRGEELQIINDENRIGVVIKGRELFINKQDVEDFWVYDNAYIVKDKMMKITIVNKM